MSMALEVSRGVSRAVVLAVGSRLGRFRSWPPRDVLITEGPLDHLDHAPGRQFYGGKLGIDATHKLPEEDARPWPEEIVMSEEVRDLVTRRWAEYGFGASQ